MEQEELVRIWLCKLQSRITSRECHKNIIAFLEIKKVLVILTDGQSSTAQVSGLARKLKNSGVVIFGVGMGQSLSMQELRVMASEPVDQHVFALGNFSELTHHVKLVFSRTCNGKCNRLPLLACKLTHFRSCDLKWLSFISHAS